MRYYQRSRFRRTAGSEAARKHIEEAQELTHQLGGTDEDVKKWFFSRSHVELERIFNRYTSVYGSEAGRYARGTYKHWKSGQRQMSGLVASRLFNLLPPLMPLEAKFDLVDSLWRHVSPSRKRLIVAGRSTPIDQITEAVILEVRGLSTNWEIPTTMKNRFNWLAQQDSETYENLLQHIKEVERLQGEKILQEQIPVLKNKFDMELSDTASRMSYEIVVGRQTVELRLLEGAQSISVGAWSPPYKVTKPNNVSTLESGIPLWLWVVGLVAIVIFLSEK